MFHKIWVYIEKAAFYSKHAAIGTYKGIKYAFVWFWDYCIWEYHWFLSMTWEEQYFMVMFWMYWQLMFLNFIWSESVENDHRRMLNEVFGYNYKIEPYDPSTKGFRAFLYDFFWIPKPKFDYLGESYHPLWIYPPGIIHPDDPKHPNNIKKNINIDKTIININQDAVSSINASDINVEGVEMMNQNNIEKVDFITLNSTIDLLLEFIQKFF